MRLIPIVAVSTALLLLATPLAAQDAQAHAEAGLAAAADFPGFVDLCDLDMHIRDVNAPRDRSKRGHDHKGGDRKPRAEARDPLPPMQVFDNLWFVGNRSVSAWLYGSADGYVLIDSLNTAEEAERDILGGMGKLGLDPAAIRMILVTHAHGDHFGGATFLSEKLGVPIAMSEADWQLAERTPPHPRFGAAPERGQVVAEGQRIPTGNGTLEVMITPGHTPGTISPILLLSDRDRTHKAVLWGGAGFNFGPDAGIFRDYAEAAAMARNRAKAEGVDVVLSNHVRRDGSDRLMAELAERGPDAPHPFVMGPRGLALFTVLEQCALAQAARFDAAD